MLPDVVSENEDVSEVEEILDEEEESIDETEEIHDDDDVEEDAWGGDEEDDDDDIDLKPVASQPLRRLKSEKKAVYYEGSPLCSESDSDII